MVRLPLLFLVSLRPTQWIKNFILFAAITFNGGLFDPALAARVISGVIVFCLVSSAAYLINDLHDLPLDSKHEMKKLRPIAAGKIPPLIAKIGAIVLLICGLYWGYMLSIPFFLVVISYFILSIAYTFILKQIAVFDILMIAVFFFIRGFAGEILTGYHIPVWLILTIIFLALFVASAKRHSELLSRVQGTRPALLSYRERLLEFYATTFATATVLAYALFVFFQEPPTFTLQVREILNYVFPLGLDRKWLILTFPFVLFGVMRYAQIVYEKRGGEAPEQVITTDVPLILSIVGWGIMVIGILYII